MNRLLARAAALLFAAPAFTTTLPTPVELVLGGAPIEEDAPVVDGEAAEAKSPWTGSIGLGFSASKTTTDTIGLNFNATAMRKDDLSTWASSLKYVYNEDDSEVKDNFLVAQSDYDRLFSPGSPWNWFVNGSYQFNQTENYRQRIKGFGGAGYFISRTDDLTWSARGGAGSSWDEQGTQSGWTPRATFSTLTKWKPAGGITFEGSASLEPAFEDFSNYLTVIEIKLNVALSMMDNLSMYFTLRDEYNSKPSEGDSYNQVWVTLGFAYGF
ncbi:MAG: DUF481 domain-containing protein [Planctomycetota bacterium]|nr:DUF481 domain-containing protein [Planctomycetota bacterium]